MKKTLITLLIVAFSISLSAQNTDDYMEVQRGVLKTEKKAVVAEAMTFTEEESTVFWPLYNEYNDKMYVLNTKVYNLIKDYADHFETMTDEKAVELWNENMKVKAEIAKLEKTYFNKFQKILPGKKASRYFQLESKIRTLINAEIAVEIPLMEE
ncbi:MAG: hypothetical protein DRI88_03770 [Bacteroidetes bacterium]|nr:MAG: hypothetical protein DRI72_03280 [Bacteroidota bacterium]RLD48275.1 MAG: hypothetical protein DRI88_03770 [Bacteroidota bacterium]RLD85640.1 MAG: hypothetical protein DRJ02_10010 [Bacteroidota bacterium]